MSGYIHDLYSYLYVIHIAVNAYWGCSSGYQSTWQRVSIYTDRFKGRIKLELSCIRCVNVYARCLLVINEILSACWIRNEGMVNAIRKVYTTIHPDTPDYAFTNQIGDQHIEQFNLFVALGLVQ